MTLLIDLAIRSSVLVLVGLALSALLRHRSAALRHWVLAAAVFGAAAIVPLSLMLPSWQVPVRASLGAAARPAASATLLETTSSATEATATSATTTVSGADDAIAIAEGAASDGWAEAVLPRFGMLWLAGVIVGAAFLLTAFVRVIWIGARATRVDDRTWTQIVRRVEETHGLARPVTLLQTDAPDLLATWGFFRPRVLLPAHARGWSADRIHVVLCHELAHVRRRDWLVQIGAEALRIVYWFNPLLWIACTRLRREGEQACDDEVLQAGVSAQQYAEHLLEVARSCRRSRIAWASAAVPMAGPSTLERRIAAMLNPGLNRGALSRRAIALTIVALAAVTLPTAAVRAVQNAPLPLTGSIYDASGAVLPGVEVTLEDAQQARLQAKTDKAGRFQFASVAPGRYVLEASLDGFHPLRHEFELRQARDWDRAITLEVGELRETITVRAERPTTPAPGPTSPTPGPTPVRVGGNIRVPNKLHHVAPVYPESMRAAGREGVVPMQAVIGRNGAVLSVRVLGAQVHPDFAIAAVEAVRQWEFSPTLLNGVPVEVVVTVSVSFGLQD